MIAILVIVLSMGFLVGFHEFSHMLVAKLFGIRVLRFSFGFGPTLLSHKRKNTSYELRLLPLGGFVQFSGESPSSKIKGGFFSAKWYKRALVALAGPLSNIILGFLLIFILCLFKQHTIVEGLRKAFEVSSAVVTQTFGLVGSFISHLFSASKSSASSGVSGPIMITKILMDALKEGWGQFALVISLVSLSIGSFNLFPFPALDGGHIALYLAEGIRGGKRFSEKVYSAWSSVGTVLLMLLMGFIIIMDLLNLAK